MPVSLLPSKKRKKQFRISKELLMENKPVLFAGGILILILIVYGGLSFYAKFLESGIARVLEEAKVIESERDVATEEEVLKLNGKLSSIASVLESQTIATNLFSFIESITHPKVYFINFTFRANDETVLVNGSTENYTTFGEQYLALIQNESINDVRLSGIKLSKAGKVEFGISFKVLESIYKQ